MNQFPAIFMESSTSTALHFSLWNCIHSQIWWGYYLVQWMRLYTRNHSYLRDFAPVYRRYKAIVVWVKMVRALRAWQVRSKIHCFALKEMLRLQLVCMTGTIMSSRRLPVPVYEVVFFLHFHCKSSHVHDICSHINTGKNKGMFPCS